ncbi:MAG: family 16 glycoside hydrolase [Planctomycetota bacterium]|jgi:hypothetical protein
MRSVLACACVAAALVWAPEAARSADRDWGYRPKMDGEWELLFDGTTLDAWDNRGNWEITPEKELYRARRGGDIYSKRRYCDFVLDLEFKVAKGTNSGVFIRVHNRRNWLHTGMEFQVLDSAHKNPPGKHDTGGIYDIQAPSENAMRPAGEWNRYVITADENMLTVELNGKKVNELDLDRWTEPHKNPDGSKNKFRFAYRDIIREGFIAFQDHGKPVWYRNVRIKELNDRKPKYKGTEKSETLFKEERARQEEAKRLRAERKRRAAEKPRVTSARPRAATAKPGADEAKAARLLKMARDAGRMGQRAVEKVFCRRVIEQYPDTAAAKTAAERLRKLGD